MKISNHAMRRSLAATLLIGASTLLAQQAASPLQQTAFAFPDPANLTGEHVAPQSPADTLPINHGAPALQQLLLKLRTRASMMLIVAHPDDEDGGLLTYESRGQGARVAMLTLTRGEGGQNLMSADFDDALGLIRTQELLAADRFLGVDQMFGTEVDFGFSKTIEEAFSRWTHDRVLYDAVRAVRLYRPLVLASVFLGAPTDGHGQHQVSGEICQEVFTAAADPKVFPEMIKEGLLPWAPLKVYARVPFSRVGKDGMFDYATGKTIPTRFENYVTHKVTNIEPVATVQIHEGDPAMVEGKPALGMEGLTYVQFARKGLALQKTQIGLGVRTAPPGRSDTGYALMGSRVCSKDESLGTLSKPSDSPSGPPGTPSLQARASQAQPGNAALAPGVCSPPSNPEQSLFEGIDTSLPSLATLAPAAPRLREVLTAIDARIAEAQHVFDPAHVDATAPPLRHALHALDILLVAYDKPRDTPGISEEQRLNLLHELRIKRVQLNDALVLANGLTLSATLDRSSQPLLPDLTSAVANLRLVNAGDRRLLILPENTPPDSLPPNPAPVLLPRSSSETARKLAFPAGLPLTRPYFSRPDSEQPFYNVSDPSLRNAPSTPPPLVVTELLDDEGARLVLKAYVTAPAPPVSLQPASLQPAPLQPAAVIAPFSVTLVPATGILRKPDQPFTLQSLVQEQGAPRSANIGLAVPSGWVLKTPTSAVVVEKPESWQIVPHGLVANAAYRVHASVTANGHEYASSFRAVGYPGLTLTNFYTPAATHITAVDVTTAPNLKIAYLPGTGDPLPNFLPSLDVTPTFISPQDLTLANLAQYDAVILGVRAYAAQPTLAAVGSKPLLDYARNGGVVILEYMTAKYGDPEAPYPIAVPGDSAHNVVEEAQPVTLPVPAAPLLNWPNKITSADFQHWVAEYGHGFAASWSPQYQPLLEAHDVGQDPQKGGLLLAPVGKGAYIYCALALYRQLPEGVPGAYRLLANLISYGKNPQRTTPGL